jgi:hypothetical protein
MNADRYRIIIYSQCMYCMYICIYLCMYLCMYVVCDGCFNRLVYEASQPSPDHFRVRQLKQCAVDAIRAIEQLIDSLDDPDGDPHNFNAALKDTEVLYVCSIYVCVCMYVCMHIYVHNAFVHENYIYDILLIRNFTNISPYVHTYIRTLICDKLTCTFLVEFAIVLFCCYHMYVCVLDADEELGQSGGRET